MTIKETQQLIAAWEANHSTFKITDGARNSAVSITDGEQIPAEELAESIWALFSLANRAGVDMTEAVIDHVEHKNAVAKL